MIALQRQLAYLESSSAFYAERLRGVRSEVRTPADLPRLPFTTKEELREGQRRQPPFGPHLCAPPERLVRMHVTSGTTGEPVAVGFTRADHEANSTVGGEAFRIAEDGVSGELVWTHLRREAWPLLRYRSGDLGRVWTAPCACGRTTRRIRIDGRRDDMLRVRAVNVYPQAIGAILAGDPRLGRHCVVVEGDPVVPPLEVYVEAPREVDLAAVAGELHASLRARFELTRLEPGSLPRAEHKTRIVHRTSRGDPLPPAVEALRREIAR